MSRIIMYGAYNLCFDPTLGKLNGRGPDFFQYMVRNDYPVNRVKVILFRNSKLEGLTTSIPLFLRQKLNPAFKTNLQALVGRAKATGITVQVCLFSYHSVARQEGPEAAAPPPEILNPYAWEELGRCARLRRFFSLDDKDVVDAQRALVTEIVTDLRTSVGLGNVVFEIANELRSDMCRIGRDPDVERNRRGNCAMVRWLNEMSNVIRAAAAPARVRITTSTGAHDESLWTDQVGEANEPIVFDKLRRTGNCGAATPAFAPDFFDLHGGQWEPAKLNWKTQPRAYLNALPGSVAAVRTRLREYGYNNPVVVINDDGFDEVKRNALLKACVTAAFEAGFGYATKSQYPPEPYDTATLDAIRTANERILDSGATDVATPLEP